MTSVQQATGRRKKRRVKGQAQPMTREQFDSLALEMRVALIQQLIPVGLMVAGEELQREVRELAGGRYEREPDEGEIQRYGSNPGTVRLGGQRVPIRVPRLRTEEGEVRLKSYELLHQGVALDEDLLSRVLYGVSCRNYETTVPVQPGNIGTSKSTVSKNFVAASTQQLKTFTERDLSGLDTVAMFIDGKSFADSQMVIALGVALDGRKSILGFVEADTENSRVVGQFLRSLLDRGLDISRGVLGIMDGGKGLRSAIRTVFGKSAIVQRCQWHKRENVVSYLSKAEQGWMRQRLQRAYQRPTYKEASKALTKIRTELETRNQSAVESLDEGFEETLTLHRLGLFARLGKSFKTTNCIESINGMAEALCGKVDYWKNSGQKHRWLATALRDIEPRLRRVHGYKQLPLLREALQRELNLKSRGKTA